MSREGATADLHLAGRWHENMPPIDTQYVPMDIFKMNELANLQCPIKEVTAFRGRLLPGSEWAYQTEPQFSCAINADSSHKCHPRTVEKS
jgi:hypothetical protein